MQLIKHSFRYCYGMMIPLLKGMLTGLSITISIGPGFFAIFHESLARGFKSGLVLATGIFTSDLFIIVLCYLGLVKILINRHYTWIGLAGGMLLCFLGILSLVRKSVVIENSADLHAIAVRNYYAAFIRGFIINMANPLNMLFWIGVIGFAGNSFGLKSPAFFWFIIGLTTTALISDIMKCYLSGLLNRFLNERTIVFVNRLTGIIFLVAGGIIIIKIL